MQLTISERLNLLGILPAQGNILTLKELRVLREALTPSEDERTALNIRLDEENGRIEWDDEGEPRAFDLTPTQCEIAKKALHKLDAQEMLTEQHVSLWEKFCA